MVAFADQMQTMVEAGRGACWFFRRSNSNDPTQGGLMFASPFDRYLMNLRQMLPPYSLHYLPREEALEKLKEWSGQDFGDDDEQWLRWAVEKEVTLCFRPRGP